MAPEAASEGYYVNPYCGDARGYSEASSPDPTMFYRHPSHGDKRALKDSHSGSSQYQSWPAAANFPAGYAPSDAKGFVPPSHTYCLPHHGPPPMPVHMPTYGHGAVGQMVPPQPHVYGVPASRAPAMRQRTDDSSSSNCTPRDHYSNTEKHQSPQKRHRKHEAGPRIPVVKIPETLKKYGHPCPATWFNSRGFPLRAGKPDCKHYTGKGWCAYGTLCKFNHPEGLQAPPVSYAMMPCCNGSSPPMMNSPWLGVQYPWSGPWNQQPASGPMQPGYYPFPCHQPCAAGPCSEGDSGHSLKPGSGGEIERPMDTESDAMYNC